MHLIFSLRRRYDCNFTQHHSSILYLVTRRICNFMFFSHVTNVFSFLLRVAVLFVLLKNTILLVPFSACVTSFSHEESYFWRFRRSTSLCSNYFSPYVTQILVVLEARHFVQIISHRTSHTTQKHIPEDVT